MDYKEGSLIKLNQSLESSDSSPFEYLNFPTILGCSLLFLSTMFCNAAGIGGGPIIFSILLYLFEMQETNSLALAQVSIFGGSIIATSMKLSLKHPLKTSWPLIDFKLCALVSPMLMLGASNGSQFAQVLPIWSILGGLSVLIWVVTYFTITKALKMYRDESERKKGYKRLTVEGLGDQSLPENLNLAYLIIFISVLCLFLYSSLKKVLVKGELFGDCILEFVLMSGIYHLVTFVLIIIYSRSLLNEVKDQFNYSNQVYSTKSSILKICIFAYLIGVISGTLGIGGGLILNPIFLVLGMNPEVSTASCNLMIFTASSSSALNFLLSGYIGIIDGILVLALSLLGSFSGVFLLKKWIDKYQRLSFIAFLLFFVLAFLAVFIPIQLFNLVSTLVNQGRFGFELRRFC